MAGSKRLGELYRTMPFGEAVDGGRGGNRYRRGRLGKTDNFYQISSTPGWNTSWVAGVELYPDALSSQKRGARGIARSSARSLRRAGRCCSK